MALKGLVRKSIFETVLAFVFSSDLKTFYFAFTKDLDHLSMFYTTGFLVPLKRPIAPNFHDKNDSHTLKITHFQKKNQDFFPFAKQALSKNKDFDQNAIQMRAPILTVTLPTGSTEPMTTK